jgi:poly-gamma-glutamate synthesis protein (capsule biosynthesis protein)
VLEMMTSQNRIVKITFAGDIMCDIGEVTAYKGKDGCYDFSEKFTDCASFFARSDYVIGNLETPVADDRYSYQLYNFNTPVAFIEALKQCGITLVSTANNHCLDRGVKGLDDTIDALDRIGLKHTGTNRVHAEGSTGIIEVVKGIKMGILAYTYGTNAFHNHTYLNNDELWKVNLFQAQELHNPLYRKLYNSHIGCLWRRIINKIMRSVLHTNIYCPAYERKETRNYFYRKIKKDIQYLRTSGADYIIMCLHAGGQYNIKPLSKTKKIVDKMIGFGVDAVITNHEHVIHGVEIKKNIIKAFSLGNFSGCAGVLYPPYDKLADYSILFNIYLSKSTVNTALECCTFAIAKNIDSSDGKVRTVLLYDLINNCSDAQKREKLLDDNLKIYNLFICGNETSIDLKLEYPIRNTVFAE